MSNSWTTHDLLNRGETTRCSPGSDCWHRIYKLGNEAIAWFNLGQLAKRRTAVRAYRHCLALPHGKETEQAARNNLAQDLLLLGRWHEGWHHYAQRFARKPGNHPLFQRAFGPSHQGPLKPGTPLLLMSEQGLGDTLQFSRYALHLQQQGFDVTLLSQPAIAPLLQEAVGLKNVIDQQMSKIGLSRNQSGFHCWTPTRPAS